MDTNLGVFELTDKQISNFYTLHTDVVRGLAHWSDSKNVVVTSTRELSEQEITDIKAAVSALPDEYSQDYYKANFNLEEFQSDLFALMPSLSNANLRLEFAALNTFATNKDFIGMQQYLGFLLQNNIATQDDVDAVLALCVKQGISLGA